MTGSRRPVRTVRVNLGTNSYDIYIGEYILPELGNYVQGLGVGRKIMVVTNPLVRGLYGQVAVDSLQQAGFEVVIGEVPDGERYKSLDSARMLYDIAFENGLDRKCAVLALGGGVIGDLAGFIAATYMRGVPFIQVPTTLLAQVDSSVGGKVAVNHPKGKNIIGAFYQPKMVFADINTLRTLADREFRAGMAEIIKYGIIWDREFFDFLGEEHLAIKKLKSAEISRVVETSCMIKAQVVEQDETEQGLRAILNFGHTFGHAYESLTGYNKYVHGEAVAIGMVSAAMTAVRLGAFTGEEGAAIRDMIRLYGLPDSFEHLEPADIIESMYHDKKVTAGKVRYILPETIGKVRIVIDIPHAVLFDVLNEQRK
ncbi:MAG: 3-dehydroquinate synthase [Firmicutes bacterium HGW-Firmicutes-14]|nr:MAG: 3-dehydroquinate synthase [Firmicutes bacterium HGW-Firmicutes-14]